jgi:hypothetical protein
MAMMNDSSGTTDNGPAPAVKAKAKEKRYAVQFQRNRSFDLHVGREMFHFKPYEEKVLEEAVVKDPDFLQMADMFSVREVS